MGRTSLVPRHKNKIRKAPSTKCKRGFSYFKYQRYFLLYHFIRNRIRENYSRFKRLGFLKIHQCIGHDYHNIIRLHLAGSSTIQTNFARTAFTFDNVGFKAFTVVIISDIFSCRVLIRLKNAPESSFFTGNIIMSSIARRSA